MMNIKNLPANIQKEIMETLKAYYEVKVWFYSGEFHVTVGSYLAARYPSDLRFIGTVAAKEVYTLEERMVNYIETFHDYPAGYRGIRDYMMLKEIGNDYTVRFKFENGNLVRA